MVSPTALSLVVGESGQLAATVRNASGAVLQGVPVQWRSINPSLASVDGMGNVTGLSPGTTSVTAITGSLSASAQVTITPLPLAPLAPGTIYVGGIELAAFPGGPVTDEIVAIDPNTGTIRNLTQHPAEDLFPRASPDGAYIMFVSDRFPGRLGLMRSDGSGVTGVGLVCNDIILNACISSAAWLPDGRLIFFYADLNQAAQQTYAVVTKTPTGAPQLRNVPFSWPRTASYSPSSNLAAYQRDGALFTIRVSDAQVTMIAPACTFPTACTAVPFWSPSGQFLYVIRESVIWEYAVNGGAARQVFAATANGGITSYNLSPDGTQFALIEGGVVKVVPIAGGAVRTVFTPFAPPGKQTRKASRSLTWSPDGRSLVFVVEDNLPQYMYAVNIDGTGLREVGIDLGISNGISWGR